MQSSISSAKNATSPSVITFGIEHLANHLDASDTETANRILTLVTTNDEKFSADFIIYKRRDCIPVGCVPSAAVALCYGRGVSGHGGCLAGGCLPRGVPVNGMTDRQV